MLEQRAGRSLEGPAVFTSRTPWIAVAGFRIGAAGGGGEGVGKFFDRVGVVRSAEQVSERDAPFQLRGNSFTMMVLKLIDPSDDGFFDHLINKIRQAPNFFRNAPVVLDLDELELRHRSLDFGIFVRRLREQNLMPVGVQGGSRHLQEAALRAGLAVMPAGRPGRTGETETTTAAAPATAADDARRPKPKGGADAGVPRTTLTITEPVRSGRQIYAAGGDLIVLAPVSAGAELLADGNIHIYGTLRGRALAGVTGDTGARIFCQSLEAELVSIAGLYQVSEDLEQSVYKKQVQIYLDDGYLRMVPIS